MWIFCWDPEVLSSTANDFLWLHSAVAERDVGRNATLSPVLFESGSCRWNLWTHENESFPALAGIQAEFGQTLCKLPCTSPGDDLLQDEWGPRASLLAQPIIAHISQSHGAWMSGLPIIVAQPPSIPLSLKRRRYCSLFQSSFSPDLHQACYFSPGNPKAAGLSSFVVFTHVPLGPSWAVKNKALERQMVSGGWGEGKGRREEA